MNMERALRFGKQAEAEAVAALEHAQVNEPVDCSKCSVYNAIKNGGVGGFITNNPNLECKFNPEQQGGDKRRNAKRTSKKRNASKKRRNTSKNNNRR